MFWSSVVNTNFELFTPLHMKVYWQNEPVNQPQRSFTIIRPVCIRIGNVRASEIKRFWNWMMVICLYERACIVCSLFRFYLPWPVPVQSALVLYHFIITTQPNPYRNTSIIISTSPKRNTETNRQKKQILTCDYTQWYEYSDNHNQ